MEKDHFKDRTIETTLYKEIHVGDYVYVCEKAMQPYAEEITDLTFGKVIELLTKHDHPRGIKVKMETYENPNENGNSTPITDNYKIGRLSVGRVVYKTNNGIILKK